MTNDGWFLRSAGSQQHLANAVFRCAETRLPMVRAANTGVTCFINEFGRITQILMDEHGSQFTDGVLTGEVSIPLEPRADLLRAAWRTLRAKLCRRFGPCPRVSWNATTRWAAQVSVALDVFPILVRGVASSVNRLANSEWPRTPNLPSTCAGCASRTDSFEAVKGIDFEVRPGEVFGLLGPNGAGKTSTVEILEGLRPRSAGEVTVLDFDPDRQKQELKDRIGVCLQATNLPDKITVHEALDLFAAFYTRTVNGEALLKRLQLWEKKDAYYATLSGGQKQRLAIALALINDPQMLFLDEPTSGLDPQVRLEIRDLIEELRAEKRTIVMTTHYIEEAETALRPRRDHRRGPDHRQRFAARIAGEKREPIRD